MLLLFCCMKPLPDKDFNDVGFPGAVTKIKDAGHGYRRPSSIVMMVFGSLNTGTKRIYFLEAGTRLWYSEITCKPG